jgi:hypothetical protein
MSAKPLWSVAAAGLLLLVRGAVAQEVCGVSNILLKDGFEDGALPAYTLPGDATPLSLAISFPPNGATVGSDRVALVGSYTGPPNTGVVAGGRIAANSNTAIVTAPIRLSVGSNVITVQLHTIDGAGPSVSHTLIYDPAAAPRAAITPSRTSAIVPFTNTFSVATKPGEPLAITRIEVDFDGNGTTDADTANPNALTYVYRQPSLFTVTGTVTLDDTDPGTPPVLVAVSTSVLGLHPQQTRFTLCSVFGTMRTRLAAQNVAGALNVLATALRPQFQALWTDIGAQLPTVASQLGTIVDGRFSPDGAEYVIARPIAGQPGQSRAYRIQFERSDTGVWRISAM